NGATLDQEATVFVEQRVLLVLIVLQCHEQPAHALRCRGDPHAGRGDAYIDCSNRQHPMPRDAALVCDATLHAAFSNTRNNALRARGLRSISSELGRRARPISRAEPMLRPITGRRRGSVSPSTHLRNASLTMRSSRL